MEALLAARASASPNRNEQKGTGHALQVCRQHWPPSGGLLVVLYGDCPLLRRSHSERSWCAARPPAQPPRRSSPPPRPIPPATAASSSTARGDVQAIVEHKAATPEQLSIRVINSGIYCFRADLSVEAHRPRSGPTIRPREFYLTDIVEILVRAGHRVAAMDVAGPARTARHQHPRRAGRGGSTLPRPQSPGAYARRRDHREARDRHHRCGGRHRPRTPSSNRSRRSWAAPTIGEDCRVGACSIISRFHSRRRRRNRALHFHRRFQRRIRRAHRPLRATARRNARRRQTPTSATSSS